MKLKLPYSPNDETLNDETLNDETLNDEYRGRVMLLIKNLF